MHTCLHECIHAYMHTCIHAYMHTCIHAHVHTCIHTYIRTNTHAYIYQSLFWLTITLSRIYVSRTRARALSLVCSLRLTLVALTHSLAAVVCLFVCLFRKTVMCRDSLPLRAPEWHMLPMFTLNYPLSAYIRYIFVCIYICHTLHLRIHISYTCAYIYMHTC